jgi:hypothetical protein
VDAAGNLGPYSGAAEATTDAAPAVPPGLVGAWAFDEGAGATTADASGNGNVGTLSGAAWAAQGLYGSALSFNGGSMVRVPGSASLNVTSAMTLSAWVQPTVNQSGFRTILQREPYAYFLNASNHHAPLLPSGGGVFGGGVVWETGPTPNAVGAWTHVALTYDGSSIRVFQNGVQVGIAAASGAIETNSNPLSIGGNAPYGEFFTGLIDDVRVYNRALTPQDIQADMNTPLNWTGLPSGLL